MDLCPGGELFYHLHRVGRLPEKNAQFYLCEIILGIQYLHKNNIIYRDLKPENVLIDIDGHIRIADFGLSKEVDDLNSLNFSYCGSPEYMAPEMLLQKGHNHLIDCYSIGAILYEMLTGLPPYYNKNQSIMYEQIINQKLKFTPEISPQARDLIASLLQREPTNRLGYTNGIEEIKQHEWFDGVDWEAFLSKKVIPPYKVNKRVVNFDPMPSNSINESGVEQREKRSNSYYENTANSKTISGISIEESFKIIDYNKCEEEYANQQPSTKISDDDNLLCAPLTERGKIFEKAKPNNNKHMEFPMEKLNIQCNINQDEKQALENLLPQSASSISKKKSYFNSKGKLAKNPKTINESAGGKYKQIFSNQAKHHEDHSNGPSSARNNVKLNMLQNKQFPKLFKNEFAKKSVALEYMNNVNLMNADKPKKHKATISLLNGSQNISNLILQKGNVSYAPSNRCSRFKNSKKNSCVLKVEDEVIMTNAEKPKNLSSSKKLHNSNSITILHNAGTNISIEYNECKPIKSYHVKHSSNSTCSNSYIKDCSMHFQNKGAINKDKAIQIPHTDQPCKYTIHPKQSLTERKANGNTDGLKPLSILQNKLINVQNKLLISQFTGSSTKASHKKHPTLFSLKDSIVYV